MIKVFGLNVKDFVIEGAVQLTEFEEKLRAIKRRLLESYCLSNDGLELFDFNSSVTIEFSKELWDDDRILEEINKLPKVCGYGDVECKISIYGKLWDSAKLFEVVKKNNPFDLVLKIDV